MFEGSSQLSLFRSRRMIGALVTVVACGASIGAVAHTPASAAATKKPTAKKQPVVNQTKGQGQLNGGNGKFGTIYTLKSTINFQILSANYQITPFACYTKIYPRTSEKLLVFTLAVKNARSDDNYIGDFGGLISAFDDKGQKYDVGSGCLALESTGDKEFSPNLKPGQGYGQPAANDPLRLGFAVARDAHIVKVIVNQGRAGTSEDVIRYYMADATLANSGAAGDPANVITPLPEGQRDPADKTGSVVPDELNGGKPGAGVLAVSNDYGVKLVSFTFLPDDAKFHDSPADDGKRWAVATLALTTVAKHELTVYESQDGSVVALTDTDGENYSVWGVRKAKADEEPESSHVIAPGQVYTVRDIFMVPKTAQLVKYTYQAANGLKWKFDISGAK
ncbi:MAG TPA: hypothetical protein VGK19_03535 [Capsulimonadaceae bacterium]|jgi:hypothetical protein